MLKKNKLLPLFLIFLFSLLFLPKEGFCAVLFLSPNSGTYTVGNTFTLSVKIDAQGKAINAAEGTLTFSKDDLEIISISKSGSIFTLWPVEPTFSNSAGKIDFGGGSPQSFSGSSGQIFSIVFKAKKTATSKVNFSSGAILAADGMGTNVLTEMRGGVYTLKAKETLPPVEEYVPPAKTPPSPKIISPTHPDSEKWYNNQNPVFQWELPSDVTGVRILVDQNPYSVPTNYYESPIKEKKLENVGEGTFYFHCQLQNEHGWGKISHFKFNIDTSSPEKFEISIKEGKETVVSNPTLVFETKDLVSGIDYYEVKIDNLESIKVKNFEYQTPNLNSGKHTVIVKAVDFAGNETLATTEFVILTLEKPEINYISRDLKPGDFLLIKGKTLPETKIEVFLQKKGEEVEKGETFSDKEGNFEFVWSKPMTEGIWQVWLKAIDKNQRESAETEKSTLRVAPSPFIKFGQLAISYLTVLLSLIALIILLILMILYAKYKISQWRKRLKGETKEAVESLLEGFKLMEKEIKEEIAKFDQKPGLSKEEEEIYQKLKQILEKTQKTIGKELKDIEKILFK